MQGYQPEKNDLEQSDVELRYIQEFAARARAAQAAIDELMPREEDHEVLTSELGIAIVANDRLANALRWVHHIAGIHYMGQAFDPDHMRALANLAADALAGKDLPDYAETQEEASAKAGEMMKDLLLPEDDQDE